MTSSWGASITGGITLRALAARFPRFAFSTRRMRDHVSFEAVRVDDTPGVAVVITEDMGELRRALQEDEDLSGDPDG